MIEHKIAVVAEYQEGCAEVSIGSRSLTIGQREQDLPEYFCPVDLISASLGSWIVLTISAVAENKKINLDGISVRIIRDTSKDKADETRFHIETYLKGDLTKREKVLLFNSARKCEVSKLLSGKFNFQYELKDQQ